jgi:rSAM/selenodomain-associated transferase 2
MLLSVIIPTLNEVQHLGETLAVLQQANPPVDYWVVDGGSQDGTPVLAKTMGAQVLETSSGRGAQLNLGAAQCLGDVLLFLHADTVLPADFPTQIQRVLGQPGVVAGAFPLKIAPAGLGLNLVAWGVKQRSRWLQLPYGDQGLFLQRQVFETVGGFPELPIMEDFVWVRRLQRLGRIGLASTPVITSARRWQKLGLVQTTLINQVMILGYFAGISPHRLAQWYRGYSLIRPKNS